MVEWLIENMVDGSIFDDSDLFYLNKRKWQSQLKDWGIKVKE